MTWHASQHLTPLWKRSGKEARAQSGHDGLLTSSYKSVNIVNLRGGYQEKRPNHGEIPIRAAFITTKGSKAILCNSTRTRFVERVRGTYFHCEKHLEWNRLNLWRHKRLDIPMPLNNCGLHALITLTLNVFSSIEWNEDCRDIILSDNFPLWSSTTYIHASMLRTWSEGFREERVGIQHTLQDPFILPNWPICPTGFLDIHTEASKQRATGSRLMPTLCFKWISNTQKLVAVPLKRTPVVLLQLLGKACKPTSPRCAYRPRWA